MIFTEDSDLNGPSPQFTLTCISTGGIPTNVTWTRNGTTISEEMYITELADGVTAQYNYSISVTGRATGLYTCTIDGHSTQLCVAGCLSYIIKCIVSNFFSFLC